MSKASTYGVALIEKNLATLNDIFGSGIVAELPEQWMADGGVPVGRDLPVRGTALSFARVSLRPS